MNRQVLRVAAMMLGLVSQISADPEKPNILFLFADDQAFDTVAAHGTAGIDTPNLDRLAKRGTSFTRAYNMGSWSGAVCIASRTMLVTGRSLWKAHGVSGNLGKELEAGHLWPQLMAAAGYQTFFTGKWHVAASAEKAFDITKNIRGGMPKDVPEGYNRPLNGEADPWSPSDPKFGGFWAGGKHWSEVVGDDAVGFIETSRDQEKPFFIYAAFNAPHDPRQSPQEYIDRYPLGSISVPTSFLPEYPHKDAIGCGPGLRDEKLAPFPRTPHAVKVHRQEYHAIITHMDTQIGRILDAIESSGQAGNTWIFFTSDHGLAVGHHGLMGKQNMYEHSLRVPFIVAGPGVKEGGTTSAPIYYQDVMATALDLAGAEIPEHVEFHSLLSLLDGKPGPAARQSIYGAYLELQRAVIHDGWKLILYPKAKVSRLYHLTEDPEELHDLATDPPHAGRRQSLFRHLLALQKDLGDTLDLSAAFPPL